jgi:hypothetical protein
VRETLASFRWSFLPWFFVTGTAVVIGLGLGFGLAWCLAPRPITPPLLVLTFTAALAGGYAAGLVLTLLFTAYWKVYVGPWGLRGPDGYGLFHEVEWPAMVAARPFNFFGVRYLRVLRADRRRPLWLPLMLANRGGFEGLAYRYAGPTHPLTRALLEGEH